MADSIRHTVHLSRMRLQEWWKNRRGENKNKNKKRIRRKEDDIIVVYHL